MKHKFPLVLLMLLAAATGCKKDETTPAAISVVTQMLTAKKWQLRSSVLDAPNNPPVDLYALVRTCSLDDFVKYNSDNTVIFDEGLIKCGTSQTSSGVWSIGNNDKQLTVTYQGITNTYSIDELNGTNLTLVKLVVQTGVTGTLTSKYVAIP